MELGLVAIFKNESAILDEWIQHYIAEGVDHFYLVDNGSTDDYAPILEPYRSRGLVKLTVAPQPHRQREHYNEHCLEPSRRCDWVMVCDLDEFIYARSPFTTIVDYLATLSPEVAHVQVPWKMFGSAGLLGQPDKVRDSFTLRESYEKPGSNCCKALVRGQRLTSFDIHYSNVAEGDLITSDNRRVDLANTQPISEGILRNSALHLNHYAVQSRQWFMNVKAMRGDVVGSDYDNLRNAAYFDQYDFNDLADRELADKAAGCGGG